MAREQKDKKIFGIELDDIKIEKKLACKLAAKWDAANSQMRQRTKGHSLFSRVSHGLNVFDKNRNDSFSEGTTQAMKRKIRAQSIQRVPDGEIITQYDKNSLNQAIIDYIFKHKVLTSEYDGKDMLKNLWKAFNASYDYGFACVRTGFEKDLDNDPRISFTLIPYADVFPSPDCKFIEEADWYIVREWIPYSSIKALIDWESENKSLKDPTYNEDTVKYLIDNKQSTGGNIESIPLADKKHGKMPTESIEVRTYYCRGKSEFITYVPGINAILRKVKNYDPRKDVPLHFMILEPDPEFPLGCSSVLWTMAQQQFADAFQSTAYQALLLSIRPPLMTFGNLTNPKMKMKPGAIWPMGTNQNNRVEPFRVETTTLTQYGSIMENISAKMMQSLNITDATAASDAQVARYSATPQGVEQQKLDKTITVNQYQKRIETFFQEWCNHALRSYINSMSGKHQLTVDEATRRRVWDIEASMEQANLQDPTAKPIKSIIDGDKIEIDFSELSTDMLTFEVRAGSLIENEKETERRNIQEMLIPVSQMMGNVGDENRQIFESIIIKLIARLCELSDIDISQGIADPLNNKIMMDSLQATMEMVMGQQAQIGQLQEAVMGQQGQTPFPGASATMPQEAAANVAPGPAVPMPPEAAMPPEAMPPEAMPPLPPEAQMPLPAVSPEGEAPIPGMPPEEEIMV